MVWFARSLLPLALLSATGLFFVHDFGRDVRAAFLFDVDDARVLIALQYHFLMTCGQHVVRKCSFCVQGTTLAKNAFVNSS